MMLEVLSNSSESITEPPDSQSVYVYSNKEADSLPQEVTGLIQYLADGRAITYE